MHYVKHPKAEPAQQWHTVFSGSKTVYMNNGSQTLVSGISSETQNLRLTATYTAKAPNGAGAYSGLYLYTVEGKKYTYSTGSSLITKNFTATEFWKLELQYKYNNVTYTNTIEFVPSTGKINVNSAYSSKQPDYGTLVITKIEALY